MNETTELVAGLVAIGFLALVLAGFELRRRLMQLHRAYERQANLVLTLHGMLKVLSGEVLSQRQELTNMVRAIERLAALNQETRLEMRLRNADRSPYTQAIHLIRHGQPRETVRKLCALTETEVDLLFSLHAQGLTTENAEPHTTAATTGEAVK